jgi:hypothetical protein
MTVDCQAKPSRKPHRPQRRVKNPDGTLRSIRDRTDLATIEQAYLERAKVETGRKLAAYRDATPNAPHLLSFSRGTHEATRAMLVDLQAQTMVLRHVVEVQRRDADAVIAALADRVARLEG